MPTTHRRQFLQATAAALAVPVQAQEKVEWRNKQTGMSYRKLGRTGLMISEILSGGDPINLTNYEHLSVALELGLNYLDMAPAYGRGDCERAYGKFIGGSSRREKVFLATKVSALTGLRNQMYKEIFDGLPGEKQSAILKQAEEMVHLRGTSKPGYFLDYFPGIRNQVKPVFLSNAMMKDYGHKVEGSARFRDTIETSVAGSLQRLGTDYVDILHCPHGALSAEELECPEILTAFQRLKQQGKVRFLGVTSHTDPGGVLSKAAQLGHYDCAQVAYNIINGGYVEHAMAEAVSKGMGVIAMKAAMAVATHHKSLQPVPQWRIDKINRIIPGDMKAPMKAYLWALQNPNLSACVSNLWDSTFIKENLSVAGKKVDLQPA